MMLSSLASAHSTRQRFPSLALLVILLLAFALRVYRLETQSLWWDEALTLKLALAPGIEWRPADAGHPPLYDYVMLKPWVSLVGAGEFGSRFFSVVFGVLAVALAYQLGRRLYDHRVGLVAAALVSVSGIQWWYSQEVRMYTIVTCEILLLLILVERVLARPQTPFWPTWAAIGVVEFLAFYTQYLAAVVIIYINLVVLVTLFRTRAWRRWVAAQLVAAALILPALPWALGQIGGYVPPHAQPLDPLPFLSQVWHSYLGGPLLLIGDHLLFNGLALASAVAFGLGGVLLLATSPTRGRDLRLLGYSLVPLLLIFIVMRLRPGFHPRYVVMLSVPWLVFAARVIVQLASSRLWQRPVALAVAGCLLAANATGIYAVLTNPNYQRDNVRGLVLRLESQVTANDVILLDYIDYAFDFYYRGPAQAVSLDMEAGDAVIASQVGEAVAGRRRVFVVAWAHAHEDERLFLPWLLETAGRRVEERYFNSLSLSEYRLDAPVQPPIFQDTAIDFGPLVLSGVAVSSALVADRPVGIVLRWRRLAPIFPEARVSVVALDRRQRVVARYDASLLDAIGNRVVAWPMEAEIANYYRLMLPPGAPPDTYTIGVTVYHEKTLQPLDVRDSQGAPAGSRANVTQVDVQRASQPNAPADPTLTLLNTPAGDGLILDAFAVEPRQVTLGQRLTTRLRWRATRAQPDVGPIRLQLRQAGQVIAETSGPAVEGRYPTAQWRPDEVVLEWRELTTPAQAVAGPATLQVQVGQGPLITLAEVQVQPSNRLFDAPTVQVPVDQAVGAVRLAGYDLPVDSMTTSATLPLTLYWQPTTPLGETPLTVFTHLLDTSGRLIAQHDGPPANGSRPTPGWVADEYIIDPHALVFIDPSYVGEAVIEVGLYDPVSGARLPTPDGSGRLLLPTRITVRPVASR